MKKTLLFLLPTIALLIFAIVTYDPPEPLVQERLQSGSITMVPSTIPVSAKLQARVLDLIAEDASARGVFVYAITNVSEEDGYITVSVAGLPLDSTQMRLADSLWLGTVTIADTPGYDGGIVDDATGAPDEPPGYGSPAGGSGYILPFRSGTTAIYGGRAVHDCGYSLNGWKAVDLIPAENMVYASQSGSVSFVCRDDTQIAMRIGQNVYTHLVDGGQQVGDSYTQGQQLGGMVTGTFDKPCGWAEQGAANWHVHFCFVPSSGNGWIADGYVLNIVSQEWYKNGDTVAPLGTLTADWQDASLNPGPAVGGNFFDGLAAGLVQLIRIVINAFPKHDAMGIAERVMTTAAPVMVLVHTISFRVFDMTVPLWVFGIIMILEAVRIVYAIYMWIKRAIPVIG